MFATSAAQVILFFWLLSTTFVCGQGNFTFPPTFNTTVVSPTNTTEGNFTPTTVSSHNESVFQTPPRKWREELFRDLKMVSTGKLVLNQSRILSGLASLSSKGITAFFGNKKSNSSHPRFYWNWTSNSRRSSEQPPVQDDWDYLGETDDLRTPVEVSVNPKTGKVAAYLNYGVGRDWKGMVTIEGKHNALASALESFETIRFEPGDVLGLAVQCAPGNVEEDLDPQGLFSDPGIQVDAGSCITPPITAEDVFNDPDRPAPVSDVLKYFKKQVKNAVSLSQSSSYSGKGRIVRLSAGYTGDGGSYGATLFGSNLSKRAVYRVMKFDQITLHVSLTMTLWLTPDQGNTWTPYPVPGLSNGFTMCNTVVQDLVTGDSKCVDGLQVASLSDDVLTQKWGSVRFKTGCLPQNDQGQVFFDPSQYTSNEACTHEPFWSLNDLSCAQSTEEVSGEGFFTHGSVVSQGQVSVLRSVEMQRVGFPEDLILSDSAFGFTVSSSTNQLEGAPNGVNNIHDAILTPSPPVSQVPMVVRSLGIGDSSFPDLLLKVNTVPYTEESGSETYHCQFTWPPTAGVTVSIGLISVMVTQDDDCFLYKCVAAGRGFQLPYALAGGQKWSSDFIGKMFILAWPKGSLVVTPYLSQIPIPTNQRAYPSSFDPSISSWISASKSEILANGTFIGVVALDGCVLSWYCSNSGTYCGEVGTHRFECPSGVSLIPGRTCYSLTSTFPNLQIQTGIGSNISIKNLSVAVAGAKQSITPVSGGSGSGIHISASASLSLTEALGISALCIIVVLGVIVGLLCWSKNRHSVSTEVLVSSPPTEGNTKEGEDKNEDTKNSAPIVPPYFGSNSEPPSTFEGTKLTNSLQPSSESSFNANSFAAQEEKNFTSLHPSEDSATSPLPPAALGKPLPRTRQVIINEPAGNNLGYP